MQSTALLSDLRHSSSLLPSLSSRNKNQNNYYYCNSKKKNPNTRYGRVHVSPLRFPSNLAIKAVASEGTSESLDHLQRAPNAKHLQQTPKRRVLQSPPLGLWDRFPTARTVQQMMDTMERLMEDPLAYTTVPVPASDELGGGGYRRGRTPWEIREGKGEYKMRFDMPGMTKNDVKVWVEENMLIVKAEKQLDKEVEGQNEEEGEEWSAKSYGRYSSRIALPEKVEAEKITAEMKDGVLYITIPKASTSSRVVGVDVQ